MKLAFLGCCLDWCGAMGKGGDLQVAFFEVADSSLKFDCETKGKVYAQAGITNYWVLDVVDRQLYVFREPNEEGYQSKVILGENGMISPLQFADLQIVVLEMLPPIIVS